MQSRFNDLPKELKSHILSFIEPKERAGLDSASIATHAAVSGDDGLWRHDIQRDFKLDIDQAQLQKETCKQVYARLFQATKVTYIAIMHASLSLLGAPSLEAFERRNNQCKLDAFNSHEAKAAFLGIQQGGVLIFNSIQKLDAYINQHPPKGQDDAITLVYKFDLREPSTRKLIEENPLNLKCVFGHVKEVGWMRYSQIADVEGRPTRTFHSIHVTHNGYSFTFGVSETVTPSSP